MSLSLLPNELILIIITYIPPSSIEAFALANTKCHALSLSALHAHLKRKHNAAAMRARFPNPFPNDQRIDYSEQYLGQKLIKQGLVEQGMNPNLEYLQLDGDLHWLRAQPPEIAAEHDDWPRGVAASADEVRKLNAHVENLGLTLPPGFAAFAGTQDLIERMHLGGSTICLGELHKCAPEQDGGKGGYVCRFLCDQQGCGFWGLYMDNVGHTCVVTTDSQWDFLCACCGDPQMYSPPVVHEGIPQAHPELKFLYVEGEWEEWMARMYFNGWLWGTMWANREVVGWEKEYLQHFGKGPA
ncbi:hypothetical protein C8R46DRAFT_1098105 [Mycena filopes]|nr:hypothetical protein C8R46DRAFT_1098105 [Mycena filopes]